ncbi:MAG TPA: folylpolyglutamate synthase/dihydrofolate synthase family protein, partial [Chthonomonadales bacterium]|nr:folylpolyglutamate synthase/dihydrofolate synthase family protein [Chthonomonadales bacterium]
MTFQEAMEYMQGLRRFGIKLGNERFEALLERTGNPHRAFGIAHIAGTKGKGSTTAMIAALLQAHGARVGGYYSPYVYDVRERVQVDGKMIPHEEFARLVTMLAPHIEALKKTSLGQTTEFELKTAVGFHYFREQAVDYAAVEVGIGGRLDATNVVHPLVCVITNIGLDHTHILGDTHAKIASEKAGIVKQNIPVITATDEPSALAVIKRTAAEREAPLTHVVRGELNSRPASREIHWLPCGDTFTIRTTTREYPLLKPRLRGLYQAANAACAIGALETIAACKGVEIDLKAVREGLAMAYLPARLEVIHSAPTVVVDGAHNAMAASALAQEIRRFEYQRLLLVIGMISGHDPAGMLEILAPLAYKVFATRPTWIRGLPESEVANHARRYCPRV